VFQARLRQQATPWVLEAKPGVDWTKLRRRS
jgi:hypothetical protein